MLYGKAWIPTTYPLLDVNDYVYMVTDAVCIISHTHLSKFHNTSLPSKIIEHTAPTSQMNILEKNLNGILNLCKGFI